MLSSKRETLASPLSGTNWKIASSSSGGVVLDLVVMVGSGGWTHVAVGELTPGKVQNLGVIVLDDVKQDK
jgi:hypothetical protein